MTDEKKPTIITKEQMQGVKDVQDHLRTTGTLPNGGAVYTQMDGPTLLTALGDDAEKWAEAFIQHARLVAGRGEDILDKGWLIGWFANAIEHSTDVRTHRGPLNGDHLQHVVSQFKTGSDLQ